MQKPSILGSKLQISPKLLYSRKNTNYSMSAALPLIIAFIAVLSSLACAQEVAYAHGESGGQPLESGNITAYNGTDLDHYIK